MSIAIRGLSYPRTRGQARRVVPVEREASFQARLLNLLPLFGFLLVYHTHDSRHSASGFPDIVAVGHGRCLFIELKADDAPRRLPLHQEAWKYGLEECAGVEYYLWRPRDFTEIQKILSRRRR